MTYKTFSSKPLDESLEKLSDIISNNFDVTAKIIQHCFDNGIAGYRLSSDLCPVINHPNVNIRLEDLPKYNLIQYYIDKTKSTIKKTNVRIAAHPSEYITLTSDDPIAINNSFNDLKLHAEIFDKLDLENNYQNPLNIHCRKDGEPSEISSKFMRNFEKLPDNVKNRLVIENNDNASGVWSVNNLYKYFYLNNNIPVTFDNLHHKMLPGDLTEKDAFNLAHSTWPTTPIFHYSEGKANTRAHEDMALGLPEDYGKDVLFEVELKNKDLAILDIINRSKTPCSVISCI